MERAITQDEWHGIQGMRRMGAICGRIKHLLRIPMICGDRRPAAEVLDCLDQTPDTGIERLNSPHCGREIPRMPHHVSVRKVEDDRFSLTCSQTGHSRLCDFVRAHLWL